MPEGFEAKINPQAMADLLAFLRQPSRELLLPIGVPRPVNREAIARRVGQGRRPTVSVRTVIVAVYGGPAAAAALSHPTAACVATVCHGGVRFGTFTSRWDSSTGRRLKYPSARSFLSRKQVHDGRFQNNF